jgi:hypothetical protein
MIRIFCDLDGVLCNFDGRFKEYSGLYPEEYQKKYNIRAFWKEIEKYGVEWWSEMNWIDGGKELWNFLIKNFDYIQILTGSPWGKAGEYSKKGKEIWVAKELGLYKVNHKPGRRKWEFCEDENDILIDDTLICIKNWKEKGGGNGILHIETPITIEELKKYK